MTCCEENDHKARHVLKCRTFMRLEKKNCLKTCFPKEQITLRDIQLWDFNFLSIQSLNILLLTLCVSLIWTTESEAEKRLVKQWLGPTKGLCGFILFFFFSWFDIFPLIQDFSFDSKSMKAAVREVIKKKTGKKRSGWPLGGGRGGHPPPAWLLLFCENFDPFYPL